MIVFIEGAQKSGERLAVPVAQANFLQFISAVSHLTGAGLLCPPDIEIDNLLDRIDPAGMKIGFGLAQITNRGRLEEPDGLRQELRRCTTRAGGPSRAENFTQNLLWLG